MATLSTVGPGPTRLHRLAGVAAVAAILAAALAPPVAADEGLEVTTPFPAVAVAPGSSASFDLSVSLTQVTTTVALALEGVPDDWSASLHGGGFVVDGVLAGPDTTGEVRLDVDVPGTASGTTTIEVRASADGRSDVLPISIRVAADVAGDITLTTDSPVLTGASDDEFSFDLTLENDTAQDQTVSVGASGPPNWDVEAVVTGEEQAASTVVEAGSTATVRVTATPPANAAAGPYEIAVEANAGDRTVGAQLGVEITGSYSMEVSTPGDLLSNRGGAGSATTQQIEVTNTGTAPLEGVVVTASPPTNWTATFDREGGQMEAIPPGETGVITATITPSGEAVAGDYVVTFNASNDEADGNVQIRFTVETSPLWAIVGIGVIVLILAGLFYVFRTYGRR
ncbi:MAG TPA: NEW3 domain-containing protein [Candidatus Limnocylindrales bacterium]|nr:NEW3 domain-containing protein [Candidatus Limnocylindrales bacterium]